MVLELCGGNNIEIYEIERPEKFHCYSKGIYNEKEDTSFVMFRVSIGGYSYKFDFDCNGDWNDIKDFKEAEIINLVADQGQTDNFVYVNLNNLY